MNWSVNELERQFIYSGTWISFTDSIMVSLLLKRLLSFLKYDIITLMNQLQGYLQYKFYVYEYINCQESTHRFSEKFVIPPAPEHVHI